MINEVGTKKILFITVNVFTVTHHVKKKSMVQTEFKR